MAISIQYQGREQSFAVPDSPLTLAELIWLRGAYPGRGQCMGIGACGRCKVRFLSPAPQALPIEQRILREDEINTGVRLACRQLTAEGIRLILLDDKFEAVEPQSLGPAPQAELQPTLLALDLGTTSLAWRVLDLQGQTLAEGQLPNPQLALGSEIMSRLAYAATSEGKKRLQDLISGALKALCGRISQVYGPVRMIGLAANPAMTLLALGRETSGLAHAPYHLDYHGNCLEVLPGLPPLWIPPLLSPFVGGDLTCGLATLLERPLPLLLADMGTNGEFILLTTDSCTAASVPLGPALEGVGMACGGMAGPGAVTGFSLRPEGLRMITRHGEQPEFISGSGYLSLVEILLSLGILDQNGHFAGANHQANSSSALSGLHSKILSRIQQQPEPRLLLEHGLYLSGADLENLLKARAAFRLAVNLLLDHLRAESDSRPCDIYLAGALGMHAPLSALGALGFLPPAKLQRTTIIGNASLDGISRLLPQVADNGSRDSLRLLEQKLANAQTLDLALDSRFQTAYLKGLTFA